jgi:hypothetical protein
LIIKKNLIVYLSIIHIFWEKKNRNCYSLVFCSIFKSWLCFVTLWTREKLIMFVTLWTREKKSVVSKYCKKKKWRDAWKVRKMRKKGHVSNLKVDLIIAIVFYPRVKNSSSHSHIRAPFSLETSPIYIWRNQITYIILFNDV